MIHRGIWSFVFFFKLATKPLLVCFSGLSAGLRTRGSLVWFPVRAHAWLWARTPVGGHVRGNHALMFLSFSFPCSLSKLATKTWKDCTGSAQGKCTLKCEVGCLGCGETGTYRLLVYEYPFVGYLKSLFIWFHLRYKQIQMVRKMYAWVFSLYHCSLKILKHYI